MNKKERIIEIDILRAIAVIGMIVFHFFYILNFLEIKNYEMQEGVFYILAKFVEITFLILVGISLSINKKRNQNSFWKKQIKNLSKILICALIVSISTYFILENYVRFGILHLIFIGSLIGTFFADKKFLSLILSLFIFIVSPKLEGKIIPEFNAIDHFDIFPWTSFIFLGIFLGNIIYKKAEAKINISKDNFLIKFLLLVGRKALIIYMLHIPIIFGILYLYKNI